MAKLVTTALRTAVLCIAVAATPSLAADAGSGERLYVEKCAMCHRDNGMGTGLLSRRYPKGQEQLEQRTNLSAAFVTTVVRNGLLNMPPLARAEVSDAELEQIAAYLAKGNP